MNTLFVVASIALVATSCIAQDLTVAHRAILAQLGRQQGANHNPGPGAPGNHNAALTAINPGHQSNQPTNEDITLTLRGPQTAPVVISGPTGTGTIRANGLWGPTVEGWRPWEWTQ